MTGEAASSWRGVWREWKEGLSLIRTDRLLVALFMVNTLTSFGGSMIDPLYAPFVEGVLHGGPTALGLLSTTGAIGGLLAALIVGRFGGKFQPWQLTAFGTVAVGLLMLATYNQRSLPAVMALTLAMFVPLVAANVGTTTMLQTGVADNFRGRVYGTIHTTIALVGLVSLWLGGIFGDILGVAPMLSVAGVVTFLAGVLGLVLLPRGRPRHTPVEGEAPAGP